MRRLVNKFFVSVVCGAFIAVPALANFDEEYETREWQEIAVVLPAAPKQASMLPFFVSAASRNKFFVDSASLAVGSDGVVRYILLVETHGGARNVTYEGIRCATRERRIYASGRHDGGWSKSRNNAWERIRDIAPARQHAALFLDHFCPGGVIVRDEAEALDALRRGGHPSNILW